jgi:peroxiredoxin
MRAPVTKYLAVSLALAASTLALGGCGGATGSGGGAKTGNATDFTLTDVEGKSVSLSQYLGKNVVVIDFWATWCKPCVAELGELEKLYEEKKDRGLVVLAISLDGPETEAQVAPFVKNKGLTFPVMVDSETRVASLYNPRRTAPFTILIDKNGKIVKQSETFNPGDEKKLAEDVEAALK